MIKDIFYFIATSFLCFGIYLIIVNHNGIIKEQAECNKVITELMLQQTGATNELKKINLTLKQWQLVN